MREKREGFSYPNPSGSIRIKILLHAQRIESEPTSSIVEYNLSTSPRPQFWVKRYAMLDWNRPVNANEGNLQRWMCESTHY